MFLSIYDNLVNQGFDIITLNLPFFYRKNKPGNDLDILVRQDQWEAVKYFLIATEKYSYISSDIDSTQILLRKLDSNSGEFLMLHLHNGICYFGLSALSFEDVKSKSICIDNSLFVPDAEMEVCLLALQYFFRRKFSYLSRMEQVKKASFMNIGNCSLHICLGANMPPRFITKLTRLIESRSVITNARLFVILLINFPLKDQLYFSFWRKIWLRLKHLVHTERNGRLVFFMGVDGSGKSTLVSETHKRLARGGYITESAYWGIKMLSMQKLKLYMLNQCDNNNAAHSPSNYVSKLSGKSKFLSVFLHTSLSLYYVVEYGLRIFRPILHVRRSNTFVLVDRSYYDNICGKGKCGDAILFAMLPKPDFVVYCYGGLEEIMRRKPELSFEDLNSAAANVEFLISYISDRGIVISKVDTVTSDAADSAANILLSIVSS